MPLVLCRAVVLAAELVVLCQMVLFVRVQARPSSGSAPSPAASTLAALALGDDQAAARAFVDDNHPVTCMIAVY